MPPRANPNKAQPWGSLELFILIIYLSSALLYIPGAQSVRFFIRALPYVASLGFFMLREQVREDIDPTYERILSWVKATLVLIAVGIVFPTGNRVVGLAQFIFQLSMVAPFFWMSRHYPSEQRVSRLILLILLCNGLSAVVGILQVYYPDRFMPPEFTSLGISQNANMVEAMSYKGASGQTIVRPPGLTDLPGAAAVGAAVSALFGMAYAFGPRTSLPIRAVSFFLCLAGLYCLYLCQVRSLLLMTIVAGLFLVYLFFRQGRILEAAAMLVAGNVIIVGAFAYAVAVGDDSVIERYSSISNEGVLNAFQTNRGIFLEDTVLNKTLEYPLGAGSGRWGMMYIYFAKYEPYPQESLWAEIQITGWLYDGGIPLVIAEFTVVIMSLYAAYGIAANSKNSTKAFHASVAFCAGLFTVGQSFAGPSFNNTTGIQVWFIFALILREASVERFSILAGRKRARQLAALPPGAPAVATSVVAN